MAYRAGPLKPAGCNGHPDRKQRILYLALLFRKAAPSPGKVDERMKSDSRSLSPGVFASENALLQFCGSSADVGRKKEIQEKD